MPTPLRPYCQIAVTFALAAAALSSCSRKAYRERADRDAYAIVQEKTRGSPWELPAGFTIESDPISRLHDPSDPDSPTLPDPGPLLYTYALPWEPRGSRSAPPPSAEAAAPAEEEVLPVQPIAPPYWDAIPPQCLARMLEFESVRAEYHRRFGADPPEALLDRSPRLGLEDLVALGLLNSREYQSQKESLYRVALDLSLERFDYWPKPSERGTGADGSYAITRREQISDGAQVESANISSSTQADALLATGGTILARFANEVVLTLDGPEDFSKDVSSELLFNFSQSLFQRDVRFNPLIQSERNVVYAARDFARFRREYFFSVASQYYGLLRTYRSIEIESQNYFSLVRSFERGRSEIRAGIKNAPNQVAVDQYEQSMLSGRSDLIATCNRLESAFDTLKLLLGLPAEQPINLDLGELELLTLRDEAEVAAERVLRWLARLADQRSLPRPERGELLNASIFLIERLLEWLRLRARLEGAAAESAFFEDLLPRLRVEQIRLELDRRQTELDLIQRSEGRPPVILLYQRASERIDGLLRLAERQAEWAERLARSADEIEAARRRMGELRARWDAARQQLVQVLQDARQERLDAVLADAEALRRELEALAGALDALLGPDAAPPPGAGALEVALRRVDSLIERVRSLLAAAVPGLPPISIDADEAMATALVQRFELMNERGRLADDRRAVKLTADDLRSIFDLSATQTIGTRESLNKPFKFTSENTRTEISLSIDLPLNRVAQRNNFREALINYQAGRRSLMALEDAIKADVRDGLRTLDETRIQYPISVTRAALAAEQALSVRLQLALGVQNVRSTDLIDALQASREALIDVANQRIGYLVDRARFVLDLELIELDSAGLWAQIGDLDYQPQPNTVYPEGAGPVYGELPRYLLMSREMREGSDKAPPGHRPTVPSPEAPPEAEPVSGS
jgi:hypothetical protein